MSDEQLQQIADRLAVQDVVRRYFELVDTKAWDSFDEVVTEDTTARWTPDSVLAGRESVVGATRRMIGGDEVVTYHHVATMSPVIAGDTAEVTVRVRAMHYGLGPRREVLRESRRPAHQPGAHRRGLAHTPPRVEHRR